MIKLRDFTPTGIETTTHTSEVKIYFKFNLFYSGYSLLHRAASWGHLDCVRMLVNYGIDLQVTNVHGERAREAAARYGKQDCVDFLDRAGKMP